MNILVVDDDTMICTMLEQLITRNGGHKVRSAIDLKTALEVARETSFDLVVLDGELGDRNYVDGESTKVFQAMVDSGASVCRYTADVSAIPENLRGGFALQKPDTDGLLDRIYGLQRMLEQKAEGIAG